METMPQILIVIVFFFIMVFLLISGGIEVNYYLYPFLWQKKLQFSIFLTKKCNNDPDLKKNPCTISI